MRILIATGIYPPEIGGPATYTALLEKELPKHGHIVDVLPFRISRSYPKVIRHLHFFFKTLILAPKYDLIFAQDVASAGFPAFLAARVTGKKFFIRVPGDYAWEQGTQRFGVKETIDDFQSKKYSLPVEFLRFIQTTITKYADKVITPSDYFNRLVTAWGVKADKVVTIYNGVNLNITPDTVAKPPYLTMVTAGRLVPWKGFATLIRLMNHLPSWHLVILGEGPQRAELEALIEEHHLQSRVELRGMVTREEVFGWCQVADVFVLNTEFESFSFQIVEAMAAGVPVVTTNVGSVPELLTSGKEGILLMPNDEIGLKAAINSVVIDKSLWHNRTEAAKQKAKKFSIESTVAELVKILP